MSQKSVYPKTINGVIVNNRKEEDAAYDAANEDLKNEYDELFADEKQRFFEKWQSAFDKVLER